MMAGIILLVCSDTQPLRSPTIPGADRSPWNTWAPKIPAHLLIKSSRICPSGSTHRLLAMLARVEPPSCR